MPIGGRDAVCNAMRGRLEARDELDTGRSRWKVASWRVAEDDTQTGIAMRQVFGMETCLAER